MEKWRKLVKKEVYEFLQKLMEAGKIMAVKSEDVNSANKIKERANY